MANKAEKITRRTPKSNRSTMRKDAKRAAARARRRLERQLLEDTPWVVTRGWAD